MYSKYDEAQFHLRMTHELHNKVKQRAKANGRSINAEIIRVLESSFYRESTAEEDSEERIATMISDQLRDLALDILRKEKTRG